MSYPVLAEGLGKYDKEKPFGEWKQNTKEEKGELSARRDNVKTTIEQNEEQPKEKEIKEKELKKKKKKKKHTTI